MAKKISQLLSGSPATALDGTEAFEIVQGGVSKAATGNQVKAFAGGAGGNILYARNYANLQDAIDALEASVTANILELEAGTTYTITADTFFQGVTDKTIEGNGAKLSVNYAAANPTGLKLWTNSERCEIRNIHFVFVGTGAGVGVWLESAFRCTIRDCKFTGGFTYGILHGSGAIECRFINNIIIGSGTGMWLFGEYGLAMANFIKSCTVTGVAMDGGNNVLESNTIIYNDIGITSDGGVTSNSDHGSIIGNSINHNDKCGIYLKNLEHAMGICNNEIWAQITENLGAGAKASSFGIYVENSPGVKIVGNTIARNKWAIGLEGISNSLISGNTFLPDNTTTIRQIRETGGTNTNYLIDSNMIVDDLAGGNSVVLGTDCPGATLGDNLIS